MFRDLRAELAQARRASAAGATLGRDFFPEVNWRWGGTWEVLRCRCGSMGREGGAVFLIGKHRSEFGRELRGVERRRGSVGHPGDQDADQELRFRFKTHRRRREVFRLALQPGLLGSDSDPLLISNICSEKFWLLPPASALVIPPDSFRRRLHA